MDLNSIKELPVSVIQTLTTEQAWRYKVIPFQVNEEEVSVLAPPEFELSDKAEELEILLGKNISVIPTDTERVDKGLGIHYRRGNQPVEKAESLNEDDDFLERLIDEAAKLGASDIHIETYENRCRIRFRIDGALLERFDLEKEEYPSLINKIKIKSNLDIAEKRLPQDGRIFYKDSSGKKTDLRVSVLPTLHGEKIVMRLLSNDATELDLTHLGFSDQDLAAYLSGVKKPNGMVLISGPTGSGKTTTLYATLKLLNKTTNNILTIEDPIEYTLEGINQVQLKEEIGLDFPSAMRTFLRPDPDVIMVGEIRDKDTASMAIRASLTGHLVMSTIHTNSAWGIVSRLADMGVPPFLLAETLNTAVAQRLVRKLCTECKEETHLDSSLKPKGSNLLDDLDTHYISKGCGHCHYTGYKGRAAIYEIVPIDNDLATCIKEGRFNINKKLEEKGVKSLGENAALLLRQGVTSLEEVYSIVSL